jgi:two-component system sensor histidine kinase and response regulator WspE
MAGELSGGRNLGMRASRVTSAVRPRRILVVDDSVTVRELERRLLEKHGYEVDVAVDGADGLNALRTHDYQLVISDVDMPRMNGLELVKRLRDDPRLSELPVIIVSYKEREEDRKMGNAAGANVYLSKTGFKDDRLVHAVRELIGEAVPAAQDEGAAGSMDT